MVSTYRPLRSNALFKWFQSAGAMSTDAKGQQPSFGVGNPAGSSVSPDDT